MNERFILFMIITIVFFVIISICIKLLKRQGTWYEMKEGVSPFIIPVIVSLLTSIILNDLSKKN